MYEASTEHHLFSASQAKGIIEMEERNGRRWVDFVSCPIEIDGKNLLIVTYGWDFENFAFYLKNRMANIFYHKRKNNERNQNAR